MTCPTDKIVGATVTLQAVDFAKPRIQLAGPVDQEMYKNFRDQLENAPREEHLIVELSTLGGDPEVARMMGEDVRFHSELDPDRIITFLGKAAVYSAGVTFMSFFAAPNRYLTRGTRLMIHERKFDKKVLEVSGPLTCCLAPVRALLHEIEHSIAIQNEGFENLVCGSNVTLDEVLRRAPENWYLEAQEALDLGLVTGVV
jgi:ATP-dependent protease ClpP protease subunit